MSLNLLSNWNKNTLEFIRVHLSNWNKTTKHFKEFYNIIKYILVKGDKKKSYWINIYENRISVELTPLSWIQINQIVHWCTNNYTVFSIEQDIARQAMMMVFTKIEKPDGETDG